MQRTKVVENRFSLKNNNQNVLGEIYSAIAITLYESFFYMGTCSNTGFVIFVSCIFLHVLSSNLHVDDVTALKMPESNVNESEVSPKKPVS